MPTISIIVPVYNVEKYIHRCVDSILAQTFTDFELILVDDESPDDCGHICDEYANKDSRIKVIHKQNGGSGSAKNAGINIATGKYIGFVDSDDWIALNMYEKLYCGILKYNTEIACCGRYVVDDFGEKELFTLDQEHVMHNKEAYLRILTWDGMDCSFCDKLYILDLFKEERFPLCKHAEDMAITFRIIAKVKSVVHIGCPLYYNYNRIDSKTRIGFSPNAMDALNQAKEIQTFTLRTYPVFIKEANYYLLKSIISLCVSLTSIEMNKENKSYYSQLKSELSKIKLPMNLLSRKDKIYYYAIKFNLYRFIKQTYKILKKLRISRANFDPL